MSFRFPYKCLMWVLVNVLMTVFAFSAFAAEGVLSENQLLSLPTGDAVEGRKVFREMKCFSCHRISGDIEMTAPVTLKEGPALGLKQARYKARFVADSIIFPSHVLAPGSGDPKDASTLSRMGDFSDSLTVKQLANLVAYLKQLDEEI